MQESLAQHLAPTATISATTAAPLRPEGMGGFFASVLAMKGVATPCGQGMATRVLSDPRDTAEVSCGNFNARVVEEPFGQSREALATFDRTGR